MRLVQGSAEELDSVLNADSVDIIFIKSPAENPVLWTGMNAVRE
jgi:hypothetical protein